MSFQYPTLNCPLYGLVKGSSTMIFVMDAPCVTAPTSLLSDEDFPALAGFVYHQHPDDFKTFSTLLPVISVMCFITKMGRAGGCHMAV
jgi:hypothetical protein